MNTARVALVTAKAARALDEDMPPLQRALLAAGARSEIVEWDDSGVHWQSFDLVLLRSAWDYSLRPREFRAWAESVARQTKLLNPLAVVLWNTDKHYLGELAAAGVPIVPTAFIEPGEVAADKIEEFIGRHSSAEFVVKPAIGSGSRDAQRHPRANHEQLRGHVERLTASGRSALLQPYLERVNVHGETALMYFAGRFSHAVRKGPLLRSGEAPTKALFATEEITVRVASDAERRVASLALAVSPCAPLLYARVDLIRDSADQPRLLELELTEPSLFFDYSQGSAEHFAREILRTCAPRVASVGP
ncbi:MAG TPA: hypothetical protein VMG11_03255 [Steroidobacteraceae bacterium]|nr:hypothetical protein [Steroidobacteraceae bacterium]